MNDVFASPLNTLEISLSDCFWYHTMDLPGHGTVEGNWDLRGSFHHYTGGFDFNGKTVLDVGTASGFLTFEAEKSGAEVVSIDKANQRQQTVSPVKGELWYEDKDAWVEKTEPTLHKLKNGYWFAHSAFQSKAKAFYGDIFNLPQELGQFDVAVLGAILRHLSDPISALGSIARHCRKTLIITDRILKTDEPIASLALKGTGKKKNYNSWWVYSFGTYREILKLLGYRINNFSTQDYRHPKSDCSLELQTIIASKQ